MLHFLLHILFVIAWAILGFEIIRRLLLLWRLDKRISGASAGAVAIAFFLGVTGPLAWSTTSAPPAPVIGAAPPPPPQHPCPASARLGHKAATGFIDVIGVGSTAMIPNPGKVSVSRGTRLVLSGWAALSSGPGTAICFLVDGHPVSNEGSYGGQRPDVAAATKNPANAATGYTISATLTPGEHRVGVGVLEADDSTIDAIAGVDHVSVH